MAIKIESIKNKHISVALSGDIDEVEAEFALVVHHVINEFAKIEERDFASVFAMMMAAIMHMEKDESEEHV